MIPRGKIMKMIKVNCMDCDKPIEVEEKTGVTGYGCDSCRKKFIGTFRYMFKDLPGWEDHKNEYLE